MREISLASLERERELLFRARYARLSKVMVFCGTSVAILNAPVGVSKGLVMRSRGPIIQDDRID